MNKNCETALAKACLDVSRCNAPVWTFEGAQDGAQLLELDGCATLARAGRQNGRKARSPHLILYIRSNGDQVKTHSVFFGGGHLPSLRTSV